MKKLSTTTLAALKEKKRRRHLPLVFIPLFLGFAAMVWRHSATLATPSWDRQKSETKRWGLMRCDLVKSEPLPSKNRPRTNDLYLIMVIFEAYKCMIMFDLLLPNH